jgi:hypothetical protein
LAPPLVLPQNAKELFNLRHSSLRVTVAGALPALKNKFKILVQKPFHTFFTQVRLVLACCILHNKILGWGLDEFFPEDNAVTRDEVGVGGTDNKSWRNKRHEWADTRICRRIMRCSMQSSPMN